MICCLKILFMSDLLFENMCDLLFENMCDLLFGNMNDMLFENRQKVCRTDLDRRGVVRQAAQSRAVVAIREN